MTGDGAKRSDIGRHTVLPSWVVEAASDGGLRLWAVLAVASNREDECWPSRKWLATKCECSAKTVDRRIAELVAIEALEVNPRYDDAGDQTSNLYRVRFAQPPVTRGGVTSDARGGVTSDALTTPQLELQNQGVVTGAGARLDALARIAAEDFDAFWAAYPRKVGKPQARKAFDRACDRAAPRGMRPGRVIVMDGLLKWVGWWKAQGRPEFVPHPTTWLNRDGWEDELPAKGRGSGPARRPDVAKPEDWNDEEPF